MNTNDGGVSASNDGLGLNRKGNALMCYAWGESDAPVVMLARTAGDVRQFIVEQWLGDSEDPDLPGILAEVAKHDHYEEGPKVWTFEIGGVRLEDVFA